MDSTLISKNFLLILFRKSSNSSSPSETEKIVIAENKNLKETIKNLEDKVIELNSLCEKQHKINEEANKENEKNLVNIMKNEYEEKFNQYKKVTENRLNKLSNRLRDRETQKNQDKLDEILNQDLDNLESFEEISDSNYLPKQNTEEKNKNIFAYIKDNSLLKQANCFLEKEKVSLEKEIIKLTEKIEKYEKKIECLEQKNKDYEIELSKAQYEDSLVQSKYENVNNRLNMSMPYGFNYTVKHQKEENYKMSKDDLKSLALLLKDTQSKKRGRRSTTRGKHEEF